MVAIIFVTVAIARRYAILYPSQRLMRLRINRPGIQEVMPMQESSKRMGHQVELSRLWAGTVL
ncbi:MAG: hypothetical protein HC851_18145 [Acaryochloris sp. RU_4_1]|nr:hypothetical protein [Acaryochloris sp. RU_4_1]NJR55833.1 hypothetical protein [Acaryochloris sp. CRU_2_0]